MASKIIVPFDNNPTSVSVRTASYTIPAGKFARVNVNVHAGGTFSINGTVCLSSISSSWTVLGTDNMTCFVNQTGSLRFLATTGATPTNGSATIGGNFNESTAVMQTSVTDTYYVPTGTVITGAGTWRAVVQEYNIIS